jgi:glutaconate CoA-transferase subunit A
MDLYVKMMMSEGPEGVCRYLDKYVYGVESWNDYLSLMGVKNIVQATMRGRGVHND